MNNHIFAALLGSWLLAGLSAAQEATSPEVPPNQSSAEATTDGVVRFGQSCALTGLNGASGIGMRLGIQAAFAEVNANGGIHGRQLELVTMDDRYEPYLTIENTNNLLDEHNVFSLIGAVGTPTSRVAVEIAQQRKVPYVGPLTGAAFLREDQEYVVNLRASYAQETEEMVKFITEEVGTNRIAVFYQDDSYGRAGLNGARAAMNRRNLELLPSGVYRRNSIDVRSAVLDISQGNPEAVIMVGSYEPSAEFILWSRTIGFDALFINISFVNSNALAKALGDEGAGVMVSQVVPFPGSTTLEIAKKYQNAIQEFDPSAEPEFFSFEGYLVGRLAILGLERTGQVLTRDAFLESIRSIEHVDLDGFMLDFENDNQGSDRVFMTVLNSDGTYRAVETAADL